MNQLPNILFVDDLEENLILLKSVCAKIKANKILALSGAEALEKIADIDLALAIIDVQMPGMNGYELAVKMNEERGEKKVPVIFLTANFINSIEEDRGYSSGAIDYLSKPINNHVLLCKINIFLDLFDQKQTIIRNAKLLKQTADELKNSLARQHSLTEYIKNAREQERLAISRELHDDLGQALTAVKIDLSIIKQEISDQEVAMKISKVSSLVGDTIKAVQQITSQLRPEIIDDLGLEAAIEWYTNEFSQRYGIEVSLDLDSLAVIPPETSLSVFRIMQESLTNIARHAKASKIHIWLNKNDEYISLEISDNGIGINEEAIKSNKSFGILGMKDRAVSLGGSLDIYNASDHGTVINLIFPLNYIHNHENSGMR